MKDQTGRIQKQQQQQQDISAVFIYNTKERRMYYSSCVIYE